MNKSLWFVFLSLILLQQAFALPAINLSNNASFLQLSDQDKAEFIFNMGLSRSQEAASEELDLNNLNNTGYLVGSKHVESSFYIDPIVLRTFPQIERATRTLPASLPQSFLPIKSQISIYLRQFREASFPQSPELYQLSYDEAAEKITRAGYCFKIDPKMVIAKLQQETKFNRTASSSSGTGMSQLVTQGIKEVYDQLGGRGQDNAPLENIEFFREATDCYLGIQNGLDYILWNKGIPKGVTNLNGQTIDKIKQLILNNFDLDIIFGHTVLKVNLIITKDNSANMRANYYTAMMNYNGSSIKVQYANSVLRIYDEVSRRTSVSQGRSL